MVSIIKPWVRNSLIASVGIAATIWLLAGWLHSNSIREEFLTASPTQDVYPLEVLSNQAGRVMLDRNAETESEGFWGLEGHDAYAQISTIVRVDDEIVERGISTVEGEFEVGDAVRIDVDAYIGDPETAHGFGFEEPRIPSDIGPHPTWFIDGRRSTWVIFVHGEGSDRLEESLRVIPSLVEYGFPVLSVTYRGDVGATPSNTGLRLWGLDEWRDLDAALTLAERKGAKDVVIIGSGFGASITSTFLHESMNVSLVSGVIYDSPVLDLEAVVERWAEKRGTPRLVAWLGRSLAAVRFTVEWGLLNQFERTGQFDVRILLLYGEKDPVTPAERFEDFAEKLPELVDAVSFVDGGHTNLWNVDAELYDSSIEDFLIEIVGPE